VFAIKKKEKETQISTVSGHMKRCVWTLVSYSRATAPIEDIQNEVLWKLFGHKGHEVTED
jgi:hypothetical protein